MSRKWNRREFQVGLGVCASLAPVKFMSELFGASPQASPRVPASFELRGVQ